MKKLFLIIFSFIFINQFQLTAENLIPNGSFENKIKKFKKKTLKPTNKVVQTIFRSKSQATKGNYSLKLVLSKNTAETAVLVHYANINSLKKWNIFNIKAKVRFERIDKQKPAKLGMSFRLRQWQVNYKYNGNAALTWLKVNSSKNDNIGGSCSVAGKRKQPVNKKLEFGKWYEFESSGILKSSTKSTDFMISATGDNLVVFIDELMLIKKQLPVLEIIKIPQSISSAEKNIEVEFAITPPVENTRLQTVFTIIKDNKTLYEKTVNTAGGRQKIILPLADIKTGKITVQIIVYDSANRILQKQKNSIDIESDPFSF